MTITFTLLICLCGGLSAALRYLLDTLVKARWQVDLPLSTMLINLLAGLAAGLVAALRPSMDCLTGDGCCWPQDCWAASPPFRRRSTRCWPWPGRDGAWRLWAIWQLRSSCRLC